MTNLHYTLTTLLFIILAFDIDKNQILHLICIINDVSSFHNFQKLQELKKVEYYELSRPWWINLFHNPNNSVTVFVGNYIIIIRWVGETCEAGAGVGADHDWTSGEGYVERE